MTARDKLINLLPEDQFEQSFVGKLLKWALSVGRYIVIGTELVVIGSFLARFSLDRQLTDLNEAIAQKQAVVASFGTFEQEVRSVQHRLDAIETLMEGQLNTKQVMEQISAFTPVDVVYGLIGFSSEKMTLVGTALSEAGFRTLLYELKGNKNFDKVDIKRVASSGDEGAGIEFEIEITLQVNPAQAKAVDKGATKQTGENDLGL